MCLVEESLAEIKRPKANRLNPLSQNLKQNTGN